MQPRFRWYYFLSNDQGINGGKPDGWYEYSLGTWEEVEGLFQIWRTDPAGFAACTPEVKSGDWSYRLDFEKMTQTNTTSKRERPVRRKPVGDKETSPASPTSDEVKSEPSFQQMLSDLDLPSGLPPSMEPMIRKRWESERAYDHTMES